MRSERICSKMETNCEIIQDLIPLYSDGCASAPTEKMICGHLDECPECRAFAASYMRASKIRAASANKTRELDIDIELPFRNLAKKIKIRRRISTACTIGGIIAGAMVLTFLAELYQGEGKK